METTIFIHRLTNGWLPPLKNHRANDCWAKNLKENHGTSGRKPSDGSGVSRTCLTIDNQHLWSVVVIDHHLQILLYDQMMVRMDQEHVWPGQTININDHSHTHHQQILQNQKINGSYEGIYCSWYCNHHHKCRLWWTLDKWTNTLWMLDIWDLDCNHNQWWTTPVGHVRTICDVISFIIRTNSFALNVGIVVYCSKSCSTFVASDGNTFENMNKYIP